MNFKEKTSKILYRIIKAIVLETERCDKAENSEEEYEALYILLREFVDEMGRNSIEI